MKGTLFILVFSTFMLSGCGLVGPSVKVEGPKVIIDDGHKGNGSHCPPGQAKKGNC